MQVTSRDVGWIEVIARSIRRLLCCLALALGLSAATGCEHGREPVCRNGVDCDWVQVSIGSDHGCALRADRTAWCWGRNDRGTVGDGTSEFAPRPTQVKGLADVQQISAGSSHTCARLGDGTVWCWGLNEDGAVGDGTLEPRHAPVQAAGIQGAVQVLAKSQETLAVLEDGTVWSWGTLDGPLPVWLEEIADVRNVSSCDNCRCAVKSNGTVWCWGANHHGQLGDGTQTDSATPVPALGLAGVVQLSSGWGFNCALTGAGEVWCWGRNGSGELGDGTTEDSPVPRRVEGLSDVTAISAFWIHACAVTGSGEAWCWGYGGCGRLGDGSFDVDRYTPVRVLELTGVAGISAGRSATAAVTASGMAWGWGPLDEGDLALAYDEWDQYIDRYHDCALAPFPLRDP